MPDPLVSTVPTVIVLALSTNAVEHEAVQYGLHYDNPENPQFVIVTTEATVLAASVALPNDTPWVMAGPHHWKAYEAMIANFGLPKTWADALQMQNTSKAINPKLLRG